MHRPQGTVFWLTGLPGAGKSTVGRCLRNRLLASGHSVILLDGDDMRDVLNNYNFSTSERRKLGLTYARLCKLLAQQGHDVICCTVSLFSDVHKWNRLQIEKYLEVYLDAPVEVLIARNQKGLYAGGKNIPGVSQEVQRPDNPDLILQCDGSQSLGLQVNKIIEIFNQRINREATIIR